MSNICKLSVRSILFCEESLEKEDFVEEVNAVTAFIDASNVYGSDDEVAMSLRTGTGGLLLTSENNLLPIIDGNFTGGDIRAREMPGLSAMHNLWVKEHNRIATLLGESHESFVHKMKLVKYTSPKIK